MGRRYHICQQCRHDDGEVGRISKRGLCAACATENMALNMAMLKTKSGPGYNLYERNRDAGMERYAKRVEAWTGTNPYTGENSTPGSGLNPNA